MKKDNKKALYESIMASVAKEVKKTLNEDISDDIFVEENIKNLNYLASEIFKPFHNMTTYLENDDNGIETNDELRGIILKNIHDLWPYLTNIKKAIKNKAKEINLNI